MKAQEYKKVKAEAENYIKKGYPLKAASVMEEHEAWLNTRQYYELAHMIYKAVEG